LSKVAYIHAAWLYFTHAAWSFGVNNSGVNELFCDPCRFTQFHPAGAMGVMTETLWRSGPGNAAVNKEVWLQYMLNVTAEQPSGKVVATGYWSDRESIRWTSKDVFRKADKHELWVQAGLLNVNVEHKVETFTVLAYDTEFPDGFSVLPPK
jgi:hypothetical protein